MQFEKISRCIPCIEYNSCTTGIGHGISRKMHRRRKAVKTHQENLMKIQLRKQKKLMRAKTEQNTDDVSSGEEIPSDNRTKSVCRGMIPF